MNSIGFIAKSNYGTISNIDVSMNVLFKNRANTNESAIGYLGLIAGENRGTAVIEHINITNSNLNFEETTTTTSVRYTTLSIGFVAGRNSRTINAVKISNSILRAAAYQTSKIGGVVGMNNSNISDIEIDAHIEAFGPKKQSYLGGIAGESTNSSKISHVTINGTLNNYNENVTISAVAMNESYTGGIVGLNSGTDILYAAVHAPITTIQTGNDTKQVETSSGGVFGKGNGNITEVYVNSNIVTKSTIAPSSGGLIGTLDGTTESTIKNVFFDGNLESVDIDATQTVDEAVAGLIYADKKIYGAYALTKVYSSNESTINTTNINVTVEALNESRIEMLKTSWQQTVFTSSNWIFTEGFYPQVKYLTM